MMKPHRVSLFHTVKTNSDAFFGYEGEVGEMRNLFVFHHNNEKVSLRALLSFIDMFIYVGRA